MEKIIEIDLKGNKSEMAYVICDGADKMRKAVVYENNVAEDMSAYDVGGGD